MAEKESIKEKFARLTKIYGPLLLIIHLTLFALVMVGSFIAIKQGLQVGGVDSDAGTLVAAYAATQLTKPIRIAVTVAFTPVIGAIIDKKRGRTLTETDGAGAVSGAPEGEGHGERI